MLPVQLKIQGIYSYQAEQVIDFTKLTEAHLFGIFGQVGSGKSTILEAISLALFGKTERFKSSSGGRNYNMMNLKSDHLMVDFEFKSRAGELYKFTVSSDRNSKNFEKVKTFKHAAYKKSGEEWMPITETAEQIIGLNYDNFHRTVIIPQGKFSEFLQLTDKGRTEMMEEIFHLQKYDLSPQVNSLASRHNDYLQHLQGNLKPYEEITKEVIGEAKKELKAIEKEKKAIEKEWKTQQKESQKLEELKSVFAEAKMALAAFEKLAAQEESFKLQAVELKRFRYCQLNFLPKFMVRDNLQKDVEANAKDKTQKEALLKQITSDLQKKKAGFVEIKDFYDRRETERTKAEDLAFLLKIRDLEKEVVECEERLINGNEYLKGVVAKIEAAKEKSLHLDKQIKEARAEQVNKKELRDLQIWFLQYKNLQKEVTETSAELTKSQAAVEKAGEDFKAILAKAGCQIKAKKMQGAKKELVATQTDLEEKLAESEKRILELNVHGQLEQIAAALEDGNPCPVCGATEHPELMNSEKNQKKVNALEEEIQSLKLAISKITTCIGQAETAIAVAKEKHRYSSSKMEELDQKQGVLAKHEMEFPGKNFKISEEAKVIEATAKLENTEQFISEQQKMLDELRLTIANDEKSERKYADGLAKIREKLASDKKEIEVLREQIKVIAVDEYRDTLPEKIQQKIEEIQQRIIVVEKEFQSYEVEIKSAEEQKNALSGELTQLQKQSLNLQQKLTQVKGEITNLIGDSEFTEEAVIMEILEMNLDVEQVEIEIKTYENELTQAKTKNEELQKRTAGQVFDKEVYAQQKERLLACEKKFSEKNEEYGKLKKTLSDLSADFAIKESLEKDLKKAESRKKNLDLLRSLFNGKRFINYISSVYLQNLCVAANVRFAQLTKQRLRLELHDNNSFLIRDYLNGGKTRSVKTLSGGQTFQASLSLALALAESVQQQSQTEQNFFFLDEGFGTQDKQSLQAVFEALKGLRKENRVVGVISHVEELQQEIGVSLHIKNDQEHGSQINASWESPR